MTKTNTSNSQNRANQIQRRKDAISEAARAIAEGIMSEHEAILELRDAGYAVTRRRLAREAKVFSGRDVVLDHFELMEMYAE